MTRKRLSARRAFFFAHGEHEDTKNTKGTFAAFAARLEFVKMDFDFWAWLEFTREGIKVFLFKSYARAS
jgi:hypothetical protein